MFLALAVAFPSGSSAQQEAFVAAVRELGQTVTGEARKARERASERMAAALAEWDRRILERESSTERELRDAPPQRAFQLRVELGLVYGQRGHWTDALRQLDAAAALQPDASDLHVLRGLALDAAAKAEDAARAFRMAWDLDPQNPVKAYYVLPHAAAEDRQRARQALTAAYQRILAQPTRSRRAPFPTLGAISETVSPTPIVADVALLTSAGKLEAEGRIPEARRGYEAALAGTLAGRSLVLVAIGRLAQVDGDLPGAIDAFRRAVQLNPNDPVLHRELAAALAADARHDEAFAELVAALLIDAGDASALAAIGQHYLDGGRYTDAVAALRHTLRVAPDRFETHYALATALTHLGETTAAAAELDRFELGRQQRVAQRRRELNDAVEREEALRRTAGERGRAR